ncbi:MAG: NAD-dependent epimerase/dehydratase family protein [Planctomycetales bacterium]|nr:NAD-dependent epimerase/dehydratase family protein [Planctomycetales bacterium]
MARALVTGSTGFVGRHLAKQLVQEGDEVVCLVRDAELAAKVLPPQCNLVLGNLSDEDALNRAVENCDRVYHLAGATKALHKSTLFAVNYHGTRALLTACLERSNPPVTVLVSSLAAAGPSDGIKGRTESDPPLPVSHYGKSKLLGEQVACEFRDEIPITIVRPPIVLGPGDRDGLELFRTIWKLGLHFVPGLRPTHISWIFVQDLVDALICACKSGRRLDADGNGIYFVAGQESVPYADLGTVIGEVLGARARIVRNPHTAIWAIAALSELKTAITRRPNIMSFDKAREANAGSWTCDTSRFESETSFRPSVNLRDGLRQTAEWYREHGWL